jgi:hypothetical protein
MCTQACNAIWGATDARRPKARKILERAHDDFKGTQLPLWRYMLRSKPEPSFPAGAGPLARAAATLANSAASFSERNMLQLIARSSRAAAHRAAGSPAPPHPPPPLPSL